MAIDGRTFTVATPGARLCVEQRGDAPTLVFVHGFGGDLQDWDGVWAHLGANRQAIRYDLRGFGQSQQSGSEPFSHVDDLLAVLDAAQIARADLVGLSMGGGIATSFALDHPGRVRRLILVSPALAGWEWSDEWRTLWRAMVVAARAGDMDRARELWWQHPLFRTTRESAAASMLHESISRFSGAQWIRDAQAMAMPALDRLPLLGVPVLLLTGGQDMADFHLIAELIAGAIPRVERIDYPALGHALQLEAPAEISERIETFLAKE